MKKFFWFILPYFYCVAVFALIFFCEPLQALADGVGDIGENVAGNMSGVAKAAKMVFFVGGLCLVGIGLFKFLGVRKNQATIGEALTFMGIGVALLSVIALIGSGSETLFSGNEASEALGDLGLQ